MHYNIQSVLRYLTLILLIAKGCAFATDLCFDHTNDNEIELSESIDDQEEKEPNECIINYSAVLPIQQIPSEIGSVTNFGVHCFINTLYVFIHTPPPEFQATKYK